MATVPVSADSGNFVELPSEFESGQLACYTPPGAIRPSRFVWLAGPGLYRGALSLASASESASELEVLTERSLLPLPLTASIQENALAVVRASKHFTRSALQSVTKFCFCHA